MTSPIWRCNDWLAGPKICIVGLSGTGMKMGKTVHFNIDFNRIFQFTDS